MRRFSSEQMEMLILIAVAFIAAGIALPWLIRLTENWPTVVRGIVLLLPLVAVVATFVFAWRRLRS